MANLVANINGKEVFSDKEVSNIVGTRVNFLDGSWCDVSTGQVVNMGRGYIDIGIPDKEASKKVTETKMMKGDALLVRNITADLDVQVHTGVGIEVTIFGEAAEVKNIHASQQEDTVLVEGTAGDSSGNITIVSGGGSSVTHIGRISGGGSIVGRNITVKGSGRNIVSVSRGNVVVTGGGENTTKVTVKVPVQTAIEASGVEGTIKIGDTDGALRLSLSGSREAIVGKVAKTRVRLSGSSNVDIAQIIGDANINLSGAACIVVHSGQIGELFVDISGVGRVDVQAIAQDADLEVSGAANIYVARVVNRPRRSMSGVGSITIGNWRS